jgi:hypothetical protein
LNIFKLPARTAILFWVNHWKVHYHIHWQKCHMINYLSKRAQSVIVLQYYNIPNLIQFTVPFQP